MRYLHGIRPLYLLFLAALPSACSCAAEGTSETEFFQADTAIPATALANNDNCIDSARRLPGPPFSADPDGDGQMERVEIFETASPAYPLLARWRKGPASRPQEAVWAVATHAIVTLRRDADLNQVKQSFARRLGRNDLDVVPLRLERTFQIGISPNAPGAADFGKQGVLMKALPTLDLESAGVVRIEPDYLVFPDLEPNDPQYFDPIINHRSQDELLPIRAPEAWSVETGDTRVRVAVLDSGIERAHQDFRNSSVLIVPGPPFANVIDGNDQPDDEHDHGTYCSALVGAKGNDGIGMTGVNWNVTLMPVKFIDQSGCGTTSRAAEAIEYAIENGADVISASWGGVGKSDKLRDAIVRAGSAGILFVASAGNASLNLDQADYFPASFNLPNMIVVGACNDQGAPLQSSGRGQAVHLCAPGERVFSAVRTTRLFPYSDPNGTSPAVAIVSGAAALVQARHLRQQSARLQLDRWRCRLLQSTEAIPALAGFSCSGGRLHLENAVKGTLRSNVCGCL